MNGLPDVLTSRRHLILSGPTGTGRQGGKSVILNYLSTVHAAGASDRAVVWNPKRHGWMNGETVHSVREAAEAWRDGATQISVEPRGATTAGEERERFDTLIAWLRQVHDRTGESIMVGADEAADYAESDQLAWLFRRAGNQDAGGIKTVAVAQRPWDLPQTIRTNAATAFVGPSGGEGRKYLDNLGMSSVADEVEAWHVEPYRWTVLDGARVIQFEPVPDTFAP